MNAGLRVIVGGGGVLGDALAASYLAADDRVVVLRRAAVPGADAEPSPAGSIVWPCDLADPPAVGAAVEAIAKAHGPIGTLVHNAARLHLAPIAELGLSEFETAWKVMAGGAFTAVQAALPGMLRAGRGTLLFIGATGSLRGTAKFGAFASAKFALRGLAQSLARELHPRGVHVAHVVIDGLLRGSASDQRFGAGRATIVPEEVARTCLWLDAQPASAWTHEIDIRPSMERF